MEEKNYILFASTVFFALLGIILFSITLIKDLRYYLELEKHGEITVGKVIRDPFDLNKKQVSFTIEGDSINQIIEPQFSIDDYSAGKNISVIYSKRNPSIAKIYSVREYKFGIKLYSILVVLCLIGFVLSIVKKDWILSQPGDMWPS